MPRLNEAERTTVMNEFRGHYPLVNAELPPATPLMIEPGFGQTELFALFDEYHTLGENITSAVEIQLPTLRAERDAIFGTDNTQPPGVWFYLMNYKAAVRTFLGGKHSLGSTVPNIGAVYPANYLDILHRFIDHWALVNAAKTPPATMTMGVFTLADLQDAHDLILEKTRAIDALESAKLNALRAEREAKFGDVSVELREDDSIVARLQSYSNAVRLSFPNTPLAASLPSIFPSEGGDNVPKFDFNWQATLTGITLWFVVPADVPVASVFLKEGALELTFPYAPIGNMQSLEVPNIVVTGEVDDVELRDSTGRTVAEGKRNSGLAAP